MHTSTALPQMRDLSSVMHELDARTSTEPVLSVYLDASVERVLGDGRAVAFQDACKPIAARLESAGHDERRRFEAAVDQVQAALSERANHHGPGLAIFASGDADVIAAALPIRPGDHVTWDARPAIGPLAEALDDCERVAVVLFDEAHCRFFTIYLDEIEERVSFIDQTPGERPGIVEKRIENQRENSLLKHAKRTIRALSDELQSHPFDRLFIGGPDEAVSLLSHQLPRPLRARLSGSLALQVSASESEVLKAAVIAAEAAERRDELAAVQSLIDDATTPHVALGCEPVLAALAQGRVHRLFVSPRTSPGRGPGACRAGA